MCGGQGLCALSDSSHSSFIESRNLHFLLSVFERPRLSVSDYQESSNMPYLFGSSGPRVVLS